MLIKYHTLNILFYYLKYSRWRNDIISQKWIAYEDLSTLIPAKKHKLHSPLISSSALKEIFYHQTSIGLETILIKSFLKSLPEDVTYVKVWLILLALLGKLTRRRFHLVSMTYNSITNVCTFVVFLCFVCFVWFCFVLIFILLGFFVLFLFCFVFCLFCLFICLLLFCFYFF